MVSIFRPRITPHRQGVLSEYGFVFLLACLTGSSAAAVEPPAWKTGAAFDRQLDSTIGFHWESSPIRESLRRLATNQGVSIWLDRRVDPAHEVNLLVNDVSLDQALHRIGSALGGGACYVGSVAYLGSVPVTEKLATLAALRRDDVKRLPGAARTRFEQAANWTWEPVSTPRELLDQLARSVNAKITNSEQIPHDLWAAGNVPAMPVTDRMTLLLAGFDLTFEIARDGSAIRLVPMPETVAIERSYPPRGSLNAMSKMIWQAFPDIEIKKTGAQLTISGTFEQHELIGRLVRGEKIRRADPIPGSQRFDLHVDKQPVSAILKVIAQREGLTVRIDPSIRAKLEQRISYDVKQLTLDELLEQTLSPVGITHRIDEGILELRAR